MQEAGASQFWGYVIFMIFVAWVAYNGIDQIKWVQNIGSPILIVVMIALLIWSYSIVPGDVSFLGVMLQPNDYALIDQNGGFAVVYLTGLMGNIAFWATMALNIPDFSRYAKTQKDQFRGQLYGMPLPMAGCAFIGAYFSQATKLAYGEAMFDPTGVFYHLENKILIFIAAIGVIAATITTCVAANVVAPANGFSNVAPTKISYKKGVIIAVFIAFFILQAWWIYGSGGAYFTWMNAYGTILAPYRSNIHRRLLRMQEEENRCCISLQRQRRKILVQRRLELGSSHRLVYILHTPAHDLLRSTGKLLDVHQLHQLHMVLRTWFRNLCTAHEDEPGRQLLCN